MTQAAEPGRSGRVLDRFLAALPFVAGATVAALSIQIAKQSDFMNDFLVYWSGGRAVLNHHPLHSLQVTVATPGIGTEHLPFTYPSFAGYLFAPLALLPFHAATLLWFAANVLILALLVSRCIRWTGLSKSSTHQAVTLCVTAVAITLPPVWYTLELGQINLLIMLLVLLDFTRSSPSRYAGIATGIATGVKLTPLVFILYWALRREWRKAANATAVFATTLAITCLTFQDSLAYWRDLVHTSVTLGSDNNIWKQDLQAALGRTFRHLDHPAVWWATAAGVIAVLGYWLAFMAARHDNALACMCACSSIGLLDSPVAWEHHWVWEVPFAVMIVRFLVSRNRHLWLLSIPVVAVFYMKAEQWFPDPTVGEHVSGIQAVEANWLTLATVVCMVAGAVVGLRAQPAVRHRPVEESLHVEPSLQGPADQQTGGTRRS